MTAPRFQCIDKRCGRYARVTIGDTTYQRELACPRHAVELLNRLAAARVIWDDSPGINDHEATALRLAEEGPSSPGRTRRYERRRHPGPLTRH